MHTVSAALASALVLVGSGAHAQTPMTPTAKPAVVVVQPTAAPTTVIAPVAPAGQAMLRVGTPVALRMAEGLTTEGKKLRVGHRFRMETVEPILVDGQTVIPAGSPAVGEVTDVRNKGMWGKSGRINARVLYVQANGRQIRMSGALDDKGTTGTAGVVASIAVIPVAGFFVTGTSARIPMGGAVSGFIDEDVALAFVATAPAPMVVGAPTAPMTIATPAPGVATTAAAPAVATPVAAKAD